MQRPRKYPFKIIEMTVTKVDEFKYLYEVFENGKCLRCPCRLDGSGDFIACMVIKDLREWPYTILRLYSIVHRIGTGGFPKPPYAIGLKEGVEIPDHMLKSPSRLSALFLRG